MNAVDLPSFSPSLYPPSAFNYERPRHFIQAQPRFQAPPYESLQSNGSDRAAASPSSSTLSSPASTPAPPTSPTRPPMRSSVTLVPKVSGGPPQRTSPVAFLCSVLPSRSSPQPKASAAPPPQLSTNRAPPSAPKPILKKTAPRPVSRSTDEEIQGSKDALIQDLEKQLRNKEARRRNSQKLSYEERMARRLLGPDNAASVFDLHNQPDNGRRQMETGQKYKHHSGMDANEGSTIQEKCYAPRFLQVPQDLTVEEGRFCRIDFKVGGLPTPDITWYLDGKVIRPDDYHKMLVCEKGVHSFIIEVVTVHHAGVYECVAKNRAGESSFSLRLDVIAQELLRPPTFLQKMRNSRALEGDAVRLECRVSAAPSPQIYWKKDKEMLRVDPGRMSLFQDATGQLCLLIDRVEKGDAGWYTVSAINEAGMSSCNAPLSIHVLPYPPPFRNHPCSGAANPPFKEPICWVVCGAGALLVLSC
uniref:Myotilin n=1 Tax=Scleropages formosus TaxID=113540 RepID=A0A8C9QZ15_SCLFO